MPKVEGFYDKLMPLLGFSRKKLSYVDENGDWNPPKDDGSYNTAEYYADGRSGEASFFIGFIERADTAPTLTRIALRVDDVNDPSWQTILHQIGAKNVEPADDMAAYPAIFFEDPSGLKLELVSRKAS